MVDFTFKVLAKKGNSRAGVMQTPHGEIETPIFMPVGTQATVKALSPEDLVSCGAQIILANTYHLHLRPGEELVKDMGGLHQFMGWNGPILTDSGGYQVSSLGLFLDNTSQQKDGQVRRSKIDDQGVTFWSHIDGSKHRLTPEKSIEIQETLGADIMMVFDEATPDKGRTYAREAMLRTHQWLEKSIAKWRELEQKKSNIKPQTLFGIIQGGNYRDLRRESAEFIIRQNLAGIAVGGGSVGQNPAETEENISWIRDLLPKDKPVYLMGVGVNPVDVIEAVKSGADMFDCVAPTRLARMGHLYTGTTGTKGTKSSKSDKRSKSTKSSTSSTGKVKTAEGWGFESEFKHGRMNIDNARFKTDKLPIQEGCDCYTCRQGFSRAYLQHLFKAHELLYYRLATLHNVRFMMRLTQELRQALIKTKRKS